MAEARPGSLFPAMPTLPFYPEVDRCPHCGSKLGTQKTRERTIVTLDIGAFVAKETVRQCPREQTLFVSPELRALAPPKCRFGFDVLVHVGRARFVRGRNAREIAAELAAKNVFVSPREIGYLAQKFVTYVALAHRQAREQLRRSLANRGGYLLHVDGTCEGDSPHLFCGLDGLSELVLDSIKIASENKEELIPFLRRIQADYGDPVALVHDMGRGILAAVKEVFPGLPDFICHFHFLRDIGKDLLLEEYQILTKRLRELNLRSLLRQKAKYWEKKIGDPSQAVADLQASIDNGQLPAGTDAPSPTVTTYLLIQWMFASSKESAGYGFPFDRPHVAFYRRLREIHRLLGGIKEMDLGGDAKANRPFGQLWILLETAMGGEALQEAVAGLEAKAEVFDKLREALRIALPEGTNGLNDDGDDEDLQSIEQRVRAFRDWITREEHRKKTYASMIKQIDKYWDKLFADPIVVKTANGTFTIVPQRTNNILERWFRGEKRRERKQSGVSSLNRTLKTMLAETPLVRNLQNEEYYRIILNACSTLEERFSKIDAKLVYEHVKQARKGKERLSPEMKKIVMLPDLPQRISALFSPNAR
jgi:hypothetical protein